jgi:hypothetical protein
MIFIVLLHDMHSAWHSAETKGAIAKTNPIMTRNITAGLLILLIPKEHPQPAYIKPHGTGL